MGTPRSKPTKAARRRIEKQLLQARADLLRASDAEIDGASRAGDYADIAQARQNSELDASITDEEWRRLREIDAALAALEAGEYGLCQDCGEPIAATRLKALPWAQLCIRCQEASEGEAA